MLLMLTAVLNVTSMPWLEPLGVPTDTLDVPLFGVVLVTVGGHPVTETSEERVGVPPAPLLSKAAIL